MKTDHLIPWYALETDEEKQTFYNRPETVIRIYKPRPKPKVADTATSKVVYRSARDVIMELTVKTRKALEGSAPFEWPDDFYRPLCTSWFEEQKNLGIRDIVFLIGKEVDHVMKDARGSCMVCWYDDGGAACYVPSQENRGSETVPVIKKVETDLSDYRKPQFHGNADSFKEALHDIANYSSFEWWTRYFEQGVAILERDDVVYSGQEKTFPIPQPYFKYLLAAQATDPGFGMGSWFDLPIAGTEGFKEVTNRYLAEQSKALMYAINNC